MVSNGQDTKEAYEENNMPKVDFHLEKKSNYSSPRNLAPKKNA